METKLLEIRDRGTFIPALAIRAEWGRRLFRAQCWLWFPAGGPDSPETMLSAYDPHEWRTAARTMPVAHQWLEKHWDEAAADSVIDVQFILGETDLPKHSERLDEPGFTDMPRARHA